MALLDLNGNPVDVATYNRANAMTAIFHEHCQKWARTDDFPEGVFDYPGLGADGGEWKESLGHYWGFRVITTASPMTRPDMDYAIISIYVAVSDELGGFDLVGFWEDNELVYLISRVDTSWSEVWVADYPTGLIDTSKPYARHGRYPNQPKED